MLLIHSILAARVIFLKYFLGKRVVIIRKKEEALVTSDILGMLFNIGITPKLGEG